MMMLQLKHSLKSSRYVLLFLFVLVAGGVSAQTDFRETVKEQLVKDWQRAKTYTDEILEVMPAEKFGFKPEEKAMTFAEQMLHLAKYNYNLGAAGTGVESPIGKDDPQKRAAAMTKAEIVKFVDDSYDFLLKNLLAMPAEKLEEKKGSMSRFLTLEKAFEHQTHHRGSIVVYLRMAGITPPHERLF